MKDAYIVSGYRTAVGKADSAFGFTRPDDLAVKVIGKLMESIPNLEASRVDDVIVEPKFPH